MSDPVTAPARPDWSRRLVPLALVLSTCLNVGFASFIAVRLWAPRPAPVILQTPAALFSMLEARLPSDDAAIFKDIVSAKAPELQAARGDQQRARRRVVAVINRPDFDQSAFRAAMRELHDARTRTAGVTFAIIEQTIERISPQTRLSLLAQYRLRTP